MVEDYSQKFKSEIGDMVLKRHRLYLDAKYWIFMRDASLGNSSLITMKIYEKLRELVKKDLVICPLSPHVFYELMKIGDKQKRLNTAKVMDEFSQQVCFISPIDIVSQELFNFVRLCQAKAQGKPIFNPAKYVWTKVAFVMGESYPTVDELPNEKMNEIRVKFFEHLSKFTLVEMLKTMKGDFPQRNSGNLIAQLNKGKDNNQAWKSFYEVFMHEIAGLLDVVKEDIEKLWLYLYETDIGGSVTPDELRQTESVRLLSNCIYNAFDLNKINKELPYFHINASLYAYLRYNKGQRFKENDLIDFSHAAWALPYCDGFFTEKPLQNWICSKLLKLDKIYDTKVLWKEEDVLNALSHFGNA